MRTPGPKILLKEPFDAALPNSETVPPSSVRSISTRRGIWALRRSGGGGGGDAVDEDGREEEEEEEVVVVVVVVVVADDDHCI